MPSRSWSPKLKHPLSARICSLQLLSKLNRETNQVQAFLHTVFDGDHDACGRRDNVLRDVAQTGRTCIGQEVPCIATAFVWILTKYSQPLQGVPRSTRSIRSAQPTARVGRTNRD